MDPALNPTPNQTLEGPVKCQWATMSNNEQRSTFESENRRLCVVLDRCLHLTEGGHPGKSNLVKPTKLVGIILNREYLSVSPTGDRGVCIIKDGLVTIFLRGHRAAVGEAGICHLRWFRHLKVKFARLCDHHDRSSGWELRQKNMGGQKDLGYPSHQHPQTSRRRICRNRNDEKLTFAPAASMLWTHSSRVSIIAEQLIVMIVMVRMVIKMSRWWENKTFQLWEWKKTILWSSWSDRCKNEIILQIRFFV